MGVLLEPVAEVNECLASQVEDARRDRWTSVGHVKVQGHSGRYGAFTVMHVCTCSGLTPKDDFVRYLARNSSLQGLEERRQEHEFFASSVKRRIMRFCDDPWSSCSMIRALTPNFCVVSELATKKECKNILKASNKASDVHYVDEYSPQGRLAGKLTLKASKGSTLHRLGQSVVRAEPG